MSQPPPNPTAPSSTPRWVKVFVILFFAVILLVVILHLMGIDFGGHGISGNAFLLEHALQQL